MLYRIGTIQRGQIYSNKIVKTHFVIIKANISDNQCKLTMCLWGKYRTKIGMKIIY